jgi:hypothetical protein
LLVVVSIEEEEIGVTEDEVGAEVEVLEDMLDAAPLQVPNPFWHVSTAQ